MKIDPRGNRILIALIEPESIKSLRKSVVKRVDEENYVLRERLSATEGIIISMGEECYEDFKHPWVKLGDTVLIIRYAGEHIIDEKKDIYYRVINDIDILAKIGE